MNINERKLFNYIKKQLPDNISFIEEIADVLDVNYDAAYRRVNGKTAVTLKEILLLSKHFKFNLNDVFNDEEVGSEKIIVEKTHQNISNSTLGLFFEKAKQEAQVIFNSKNGQIYNCAKDYPFYHSDSGLLKRFRLFVFINMLSRDSEAKKVPFSNFKPSASILGKYDAFLNQYKKNSLVEIWNDSTIDNVLNQVQYFFEVGLTTKDETIAISNGLKDSLNSIQEQAKNNKRTQNNNPFQLYHNNIISLLNTIVMKTDVEKTIFVPYTNLTYFKIIDKNTTNQIEQYLKTQIEFSNNLTGEASVERNKFFNAMHQKIDTKILKLIL